MGLILLVSTDKDWCGALAKCLRFDGHRIIVECPELALGAAKAHLPDLVLVSVDLPGRPGLRKLLELRQCQAVGRIPVSLVGVHSDADRVLAYELGASDVMPVGVGARELRARVRAVLGRWNAADGLADTLELDELEIDQRAHRVRCAGEELELTPIEWDLLLALIRHGDHVMSRGDLITEVWGSRHGSLTRTVDTHVKRLRTKLRSASRFIETVRGHGYRFSPEHASPRRIQTQTLAVDLTG